MYQKYFLPKALKNMFQKAKTVGVTFHRPPLPSVIFLNDPLCVGKICPLCDALTKLLLKSPLVSFVLGFQVFGFWVKLLPFVPVAGASRGSSESMSKLTWRGRFRPGLIKSRARLTTWMKNKFSDTTQMPLLRYVIKRNNAFLLNLWTFYACKCRVFVKFDTADRLKPLGSTLQNF